MGMYYGKSEPPPKEDKSGCRDVFSLTRAAFGILLIPLGVLVGAVAVIILLVALFSHGPIFGLPGIALVAAGIYAYARWERHHFRGP
jgi:hypothetical protein